MEWNKKCPICGCYMQLTVKYMHGIPHTIVSCPACGEQKPNVTYSSSTNPDEPFQYIEHGKEDKNEKNK